MRRILKAFAAGCVLLLPAGVAHAQTAAELLNGRKALQCYHNDTNVVYCKELLSGQTWKVFTRAEGTWEPWCGTINRDGTKLTCNDGSVPIVINLDGTRKEPLAPEGTNCHFWRDSDGSDWVVYTPESEQKNRVGTTWKVRIDHTTNKPVEATRTKIADIQFSCGLNGSGVYLGESYGTAIIKNLMTGEQSPDFNDTRNCVGTMHPGDKPWIMFEESPVHDRVGIFEWNESAGSARRIWRLEKPDVFGLWSPNNEHFGVILNNGNNAAYKGSLDLIRIAVDTSGDSDNDGAWQIAPMGIIGMVGGPWVERETGVINTRILNSFREGRLQREKPVTVHLKSTATPVSTSVWDLKGRLVGNGPARSLVPGGCFFQREHQHSR